MGTWSGRLLEPSSPPSEGQLPFETYIFDAPDNADVEIFGLDQQLARHYRIEELSNATFSH